MEREISHRTRDRYLTADEAAKYRSVREQIEAEKPEIDARIRSQLTAIASAQKVFGQLQRIREAKGLGLHEIQELTGIEASVLAKLEAGERDNFTVDTVIRYAQALGKEIAINLCDAG